MKGDLFHPFILLTFEFIHLFSWPLNFIVYASIIYSKNKQFILKMSTAEAEP